MSSSPIVKPSGALKILRDTSKALRLAKKVDPRERYVLLYPDSEAAFVGMGFKLLKTRPAEEVYEKASDILKKDVFKLCLEGPKPDLYDSLENRNIATFVTSQATIAKLAHEKPSVIPFCKASGGIGIGFVNCLVFSGVITFEDGLDLVQRQGQAMDRAAKIIPTAKLKVRVRPATRKVKVCKAAQEHCISLGIPEEVAICSITKQSYAHNLEIAGHEEAIKYLEKDGSDLFGFIEVKLVKKTPHAFHTQLMRPCKEFIRGYIDSRLKENPQYLKEPENCSLYSSTAGYRLRTTKSIRQDLIDYPVESVKIEQLFHTIFKRPKELPQPNTLILWDRKLKDNLYRINFPAWRRASILEA